MATIVAVSGGGSTAREPAGSREPNAARRTYALLAGIPQNGSVLGYPRAPVTLQFFGDLQCTESRQVMLGALPPLIRRWVRGGELRIRFRSKHTDTPDWGEFLEQQTAALAAGAQDALWSFVSIFYREQGRQFSGYADRAFLEGIAARSRIDVERWRADWSTRGWTSRIVADQALANRQGLRSTPTFLVGRTGEKARPLLHFALEEPAVFEEAIEELLRPS